MSTLDPTIDKILDNYLKSFPKEVQRLRMLAALTKKFPAYPDLVRRSNFEGHITSSAVLICRKTRRSLHFTHPVLGMNIQPGGHIPDATLSPLDNALKQLHSKILSNPYEPIPFVVNPDVPFDIDTHPIPANDKLNEPAHYHHDWRYLFYCEEEFELDRADYSWEDSKTLGHFATYQVMLEKVNSIFAREFQERRFYHFISKANRVDQPFGIIAVQHFLPGINYFVDALDTIGDVIGLIPKKKSEDITIVGELSKRYHIIHHDKHSGKLFTELVQLINNYDGRTVLIDIGGYFAPYIDNFSSFVGDKVIGIVEDTENGHQKYEALQSPSLPIFSVARSELKAMEDNLIGQSIYFSTDAFLRQVNRLIQFMTCGVIGYGKIGKSIAKAVLRSGSRPFVCDLDPVRLIEASNDGCIVLSKAELLAQSDVVFCATGRKSISTSELLPLKDTAFIASVTSADDEFDFADLDTQYQFEDIAPSIRRYYRLDKSFHLLEKGNAVNFAHKAVVGDYIHLVKGEMIACMNELVQGTPPLGLSALGKEKKHEVARLWLKAFHGID